MDIKHNKEQEMFYMYSENGDEVGYLDYKLGGDNKLYAMKTEVYSQYGGKGYAGILLDEFVEYAKNINAKITPICPYVIGAFGKYPQKYKDVI